MFGIGISVASVYCNPLTILVHYPKPVVFGQCFEKIHKHCPVIGIASWERKGYIYILINIIFHVHISKSQKNTENI